MALVPLNLFVTHDGKSRRQHVTCRYKCGDACSKPVRNTSDNEYFGDIAKEVSRRSILQASGVAVLAVGAGSVLAACGKGEQPAATPTSSTEPPAETPAGMKFDAVAPNSEDAVVIPDGYKQGVVISWGDPILDGAPKFDVRNQTGAAQRGQFGFNNDFAGLLPIDGQPNRFLLVTNHEYVDAVVHVPRLQGRRADPRAVRRRDRRDRHGRRGGRTHPRRRSAARDGPLQPAHHRRHPDDVRRARRRAPTSSRRPPTRQAARWRAPSPTVPAA